VLSTLLYSADPQLVDDGQTTVGEQHAGGLWTVELDGERDELEAPTGGVPETPASEASSRLASGLRVGDATPSRSYPPSDAASVAKFTPARSERGAAASPPPSHHAPSVRSPLAPLSRGIQKKRASQASEPIHTVFQEKKAQQKRPTRAAGRR
jgi:hypothetical protein